MFGFYDYDTIKNMTSWAAAMPTNPRQAFQSQVIGHYKQKKKQTMLHTHAHTKWPRIFFLCLFPQQ